MSGGSKKAVVAWWYRILLHLGWCKGPIDAWLELRGGNRVAWRGGLTASGQLNIDKPNLWGGKKKEGGMVGALDVLFGEPAQTTNDYLTAQQGADQPTYRGKVTSVWRGGRFGTNPYPKELAAKVRRILQGWDGGAAWYPEKAEIVMSPGESFGTTAAWDYVVLPEEADPGNTNLTPPASGWATANAPFGGGQPAAGQPAANGLWPIKTVLWLRRDVVLDGNKLTRVSIYAENGCVVIVNGAVLGSINRSNNQATQVAEVVDIEFVAAGALTLYIKGFDEIDPGGGTYLSASLAQLPLIGMNPAHILYDTLTAADMKGEPTGLINDASFRAAADVLHAEGLGLCMRSDEYSSIEAMQQQILDIIGGSLTQSRVDGLYYLDLLRPPADIGALPIITSDDVFEFRQQPAAGTHELVNQILVNWRDPERNEDRTTAPLQALGGIQAAGGTISETHSYPEIPTESLALRIGERDLQARGGPLSRFDLVTSRRPWAIRKGTHFRLQLPEEGIADMVCVLLDNRDSGLVDGKLQLKAIQDVFSMPTASYVVGEPGKATPPATTPTSPPFQFLIESPYVELAARLSPSELAVFPEDSSAFIAIATQPAVGLNYSLYSAGAGEALDDYATGEWCPTALIVEAADYLDTAFTLSAPELLDRVTLGTWALWDTEIVRVEALDTGAGTLTLARGCIDTVPVQHLAASRIYFAGEWYATDGREYAAVEAVTAKLLVSSGSAEQTLDDAPLLSLTLDDRPDRPYPPGQVKINGSPYPDYIVGAHVMAWAHRDRLLQADQTIDTTQGNIGPEAGTTYTRRLYGEADTLLRTETGLSVLTSTWTTEEDDSGVTIPGSAPPGDYVTEVSADAPAGWWRLDETSGTTAADSSGAGLTGTYGSGVTLNQTPLIVSGKSISANAASQPAMDAPRVVVSTVMSAEIWVQFGAAPAAQRAIFASASTSVASAWIVFLRADGTILVNLRYQNAATGQASVASPASVVDGQRHLIGFAWDKAGDQKVHLYIDEVQVAESAVWNQTIYSHTSHRTQIYNAGAETYGFDEAAVYTSFLSAARMLAHYRAGALGAGAEAPRRNNLVRAELESVRDGLVSHQFHNITTRRVGYGYSYGYSYGGL